MQTRDKRKQAAPGPSDPRFNERHAVPLPSVPRCTKRQAVPLSSDPSFIKRQTSGPRFKERQAVPLPSDPRFNEDKKVVQCSVKDKQVALAEHDSLGIDRVVHQRGLEHASVAFDESFAV